MENHLRIALTFSGGGYRAAAFHLGTLSYLDSIKIGESCLSDYLTAMSTISGGSITGLYYMLGLLHKKDFSQIFDELYHFFMNVDLATQAMDGLDKREPDKYVSLIRTMADVYNKELFEGATLGMLMDCQKAISIKHFSANATDFTNGLPFRFQVTSKTGIRQELLTGYGLIGNKKNFIPREIAQHIRLADVLACSSCFPGGFEPMVFPSDFKLGDSEEIKKYIIKTRPFGIMDGGIVDNQGIDPILLAEERMEKDQKSNEKCLDLVIISDVSGPYMDSYEISDIHLPKSIGNITLNKITTFLWILCSILTICTIISYIVSSISFISGVLTTVLVFAMSGMFFYSVLKKKLIDRCKKTIISERVSSLLKISFNDLTTLVVNRINSVKLLITSVFMKHIRRMDYRSVYRDDGWINRRIMNAVYELRSGEAWMQKEKLPNYLKPSVELQKNSERAASMGTTLWFSKEDKEGGMADALIADGQYTICWNLLEYIERIKEDKTNTNKNHELILACEEQLKKDWNLFQKDPLFRLKEWKLLSQKE